MKPQHDQKTLDTAWQEVKSMIHSSGIIEPEPGFVERWQEQLAQRRLADERRSTWRALILTTVASLVLLGLIGLIVMPSIHSISDLFVGLVNLAAGVFVYIQMTFAVLASFARVLPGLFPLSWWVSITAAIAGAIMVWASTFRQYVQLNGVFS